MHNLHIIVTNASSHEEACLKAETSIEDWGGENNWRTICGSVSNKGNIYSTNDGRYCPEAMLDFKNNSVDFIQDAKGTTREEKNLTILNRMVSGWSSDPKDTSKLQTIASDLFSGKDVPSYEIYQLKNYIEHKYSQVNSSGDDVWGSTYREWQLDECGVTNIVDDESETLYAVFVDMHS
jgi:hypothetical protein